MSKFTSEFPKLCVVCCQQSKEQLSDNTDYDPMTNMKAALATHLGIGAQELMETLSRYERNGFRSDVLCDVPMEDLMIGNGAQKLARAFLPLRGVREDSDCVEMLVKDAIVEGNVYKLCWFFEYIGNNESSPNPPRGGQLQTHETVVEKQPQVSGPQVIELEEGEFVAEVCINLVNILVESGAGSEKSLASVLRSAQQATSSPLREFIPEIRWRIKKQNGTSVKRTIAKGAFTSQPTNAALWNRKIYGDDILDVNYKRKGKNEDQDLILLNRIIEGIE